MTAFLQFDSYINEENAKKALESYVGILQEAFKHYQNLLDNYIKLQDEHKQCSSQFSSKDRPCTHTKEELLSQTHIKEESPSHTHIKEELLSQKQLNIHDSKQENNITLPELDISYFSDTSPHEKNSENASPKSPILCKTYLNNSNTFARNLMQLDSVYDNSTSNMKNYHSNKEVSAKCNTNLKLSTSQHVETTFLSDGKKLKQTRLVFKKVPSTNVNQSVSTGISPKELQQNSREDISVSQASTTADSNITNVNETVIDISPTQRDVMSNLRRCLQLKRKLPSRRINTSPKKKNNSSDHKDLIPIVTVTDTNIRSYTPEHSTQMEDDKSFIKHFDTHTVNSPLKDNTTAAPLVEINNIPDVQIISPDKTKKTYQLGIDRIQCTSEKNNCPAYEEETFCFSVEQSMNRDTNVPSLDNTENRPPPVKKLLLNSSSKTDDVEEQLNMRCKSDRAKLRGRDCWECEEYYKNLALPKEELQKRKNYCSRHRDKYERASTPEGFWDPEFPETLSSTYK